MRSLRSRSISFDGQIGTVPIEDFRRAVAGGHVHLVSPVTLRNAEIDAKYSDLSLSAVLEACEKNGSIVGVTAGHEHVIYGR